MSQEQESGGDVSRKAASGVAAALRRRIIRGDLAEGDLLPAESDLLNHFGVSRPTLREAVRVLESESLVVVRRGQNGGIEVSVPSVDTLARYAGLVLEYRRATTADVFKAACAIEAPCAAMLAHSRTVADLGELRAVVDAEQVARDDPPLLLDLQNEFHRLVIDLAGNATLRVLSDVLRHIIEIATARYIANPGLRAEERIPASDASIRTHRKLVSLIEKRDAASAESLWRRQILSTGEFLQRSGVADTVIELLS